MTQQTDRKKKPLISLRQRALDYLAKREYSVVELGRKLQSVAKQYELDSEEIPEILADFQKRNWVSDTRFTEQILHARKTKFGSAHIAHELREKGVAADLIAIALDEIDSDLEYRAALELGMRKARSLARFDEDVRERRLVSALQRKGFNFSVISAVLKEI